EGAAVRIAMTVGRPGVGEGLLCSVVGEMPSDQDAVSVQLDSRRGFLHADLTIGANVVGARALRANDRLSNRGVIPHGAGFIVTPEKARRLGLGVVPGLD